MCRLHLYCLCFSTSGWQSECSRQKRQITTHVCNNVTKMVSNTATVTINLQQVSHVVDLLYISSLGGFHTCTAVVRLSLRQLEFLLTTVITSLNVFLVLPMVRRNTVGVSACMLLSFDVPAHACYAQLHKHPRGITVWARYEQAMHGLKYKQIWSHITYLLHYSVDSAICHSYCRHTDCQCCNIE